MRICAAWLLKHVAASSMLQQRQPSILMSGQCSLTPILRSLGRSFLVCTHIFTLVLTKLPLVAMRRKVLWTMRRDSSRTRPKPCSPWVIINTGCCVITGLPKPRSSTSAKCYPVVARHQEPSA